MCVKRLFVKLIGLSLTWVLFMPWATLAAPNKPCIEDRTPPWYQKPARLVSFDQETVTRLSQRMNVVCEMKDPKIEAYADSIFLFADSKGSLSQKRPMIFTVNKERMSQLLNVELLGADSYDQLLNSHPASAAYDSFVLDSWVTLYAHLEGGEDNIKFLRFIFGNKFSKEGAEFTFAVPLVRDFFQTDIEGLESAKFSFNVSGALDKKSGSRQLYQCRTQLTNLQLKQVIQAVENGKCVH